MHLFPEQAHRFATTRDQHAHTQANIDCAVDEYGQAAAAMAVEFLILGAPDAALDVMTDCLVEQCKLAKIRHLEVVPAVTP